MPLVLGIHHQDWLKPSLWKLDQSWRAENTDFYISLDAALTYLSKLKKNILCFAIEVRHLTHFDKI